MNGYPDPRTMGALAAGLGILGANQWRPGRMGPNSLGGALGVGGMAGMNAYMATLQAEQKRQAHEAALQIELAKFVADQNKPLAVGKSLVTPGGTLLYRDPETTKLYYTGEGWLPAEEAQGKTKPERSQSFAPNFQALATPGGYLAFDTRAGAAAPLMVGGQRAIPSASSPELQGEIAAAKEEEKALAKRRVERPVAERALNTTMMELDQLREQAQRVLSHKGLWLATGVTGPGVSTVVPAARDAWAELETLVSKVGFTELQSMRDLSKTGGALGQITVRELELLQNSVVALQQSQSYGQMRANLQRLMSQTERVQTLMQGWFRDIYGNEETAPTPGTEEAGATPPIGIIDLRGR